MFHVEHMCESVEETAALAARIATIVRAGDVLALDGPMGAGKTTFVRALARAMGVDTAGVSSPTFVMVNEYDNPNGPDLVHVDAYRLSGSEDLDLLGWDTVTDPHEKTVLVIEWPGKIADEIARLGDRVATIRIEPTGEESRLFHVDLPNSWRTRDGAERLGVGGRVDTTCPMTGRAVSADSPTWPFADERARMADLYRWMSGQYSITRSIEEADLEQGE